MTGRMIGLGGIKASGKDAVADRLVSEHDFVKIGMSDPLLTMLLTIDPWVPINALDDKWQGHSRGHFVRASWLVAHVGYVEAKTNPEVRRLLQMIGDEAGRRLHGENVWVDFHHRFIAPRLEAGQDVVLTGVRYPNEVELVKRLGGVSVWVDRPGVVNDSTHASENSVTKADFDFTLDNDSTLDALGSKTSEMLAWMTTVPKLTIASGGQNVLVAGSMLMQMPAAQPQNPEKAIVESATCPPMIVDRSRVQLIA